jgi:hypothetical protein
MRVAIRIQIVLARVGKVVVLVSPLKNITQATAKILSRTLVEKILDQGMPNGWMR